MDIAPTLTAGLACLPDPPTDRPGKPVPEGIAGVLSIVAILIEYGRHLAETIEHRAVWRGFATIAQFFGTAAVPVMLAHIQRGIMRAVVLERMLRRRAARGRDLAIRARRGYAQREAEPTAPHAEPAATVAAGPQPAEAPAAQRPASRPVRRGVPEEALSLDTLPSIAQLEAEVRRRPIGRTIVDICRDLGVSPSLCEGLFWDRVFMAIRWYRGNVTGMILELRRREKRFDKEQWKHPDLGLPEYTRAGIRRALGFAIGEPPADPFRPVPAASAAASGAAPDVPVAEVATGPP